MRLCDYAINLAKGIAVGKGRTWWFVLCGKEGRKRLSLYLVNYCLCYKRCFSAIETGREAEKKSSMKKMENGNCMEG
jgi:hypothetical protein